MTDDERYMRRALDLAALGMGYTSPNPVVGAVIVHSGSIIGEGYHHRSGQPHAEVMAVNSVQERELLPESTIYVTLEPCSHHGKTPPCADLILHERIPRVVVAIPDPFPRVAGRGLERLRQAGVEVIVGVLAEEARQINAPFLTAQSKHRPLVTLKWAQSLDGFIDRVRQDSSQSPTLFSTPQHQREVHRERMHHDAILVGYKTALLDDPQLTNRFWYGSSPIRLILDPRLTLPRTLRLFNDGLAPTWILYLKEAGTPAPCEGKGVRFLPFAGERIEPEPLLHRLYEEGIASILIEGGAATLSAFLRADLYDRLLVEVAPMSLGAGIAAPAIPSKED
ncbi:bifunctional diaminohydroxyphosphoribosylaminopyrimidine deaminase/5-amino-6-(5-phosphoribosylamino)uracil reductase RibD [Porphyromonas sp.]